MEPRSIEAIEADIAATRECGEGEPTSTGWQCCHDGPSYLHVIYWASAELRVNVQYYDGAWRINLWGHGLGNTRYNTAREAMRAAAAAGIVHE